MLPAASSSRRDASFSTRLVGELLELLLQVCDFRVHRVLALGELLCARLTPFASLIEAVHVGRHFFLFLRELFRLTQGALDVALAAAALVSFELLLRLAQTIERLLRLRAAVARSVRRR